MALLAAARKVARDLVRNWATIVGMGAMGFLVLMFMTRLLNDVYVQYNVKADLKRDAEARVRWLCGDPQLVYEINYGDECRKFMFVSQTVPIWEAWCAVADSYRLCDARTGCSGSVVLLLMTLPVTVLIMYVMYRATPYYRNCVRGFNDHHDSAFMYEQQMLHSHGDYGHVRAIYSDPHKCD